MPAVRFAREQRFHGDERDQAGDVDTPVEQLLRPHLRPKPALVTT